MVSSTHNPEPSRSTLPLSKIFKFHPLQVWTRFVKFGEIHISSSPKILPKFRQPSDAMRDHHTKDQLQIKSPHARIISSNTWSELFMCIFSKFSKFRFCSVVFRQGMVTDHLCTLALCAQPLPPGQSTARPLGRTQASVAASIFNAGSLCGGRATRGDQTEPAPAHYTVLRRPLLPSPPRGSCMLAHPRSTVAVARQAQGAPSITDGPAPPCSVESTQDS